MTVIEETLKNEEVIEENNDKVILSNNIKIDGNVLISAIIPHEDDRFVIRIYNPSSKKEIFTLYNIQYK